MDQNNRGELIIRHHSEAEADHDHEVKYHFRRPREPKGGFLRLSFLSLSLLLVWTTLELERR